MKQAIHRQRRGAVLALVAILMVVLLGMVAFAVDMGYISLARTQLQNAVDSGAMAAASVMSNNQASVIAEARKFVAANPAAAQSVNISDSDVEFGYWDINARTFSAGAQHANAVRVTARRENAGLFFGKVLGIDTFSTEATATAMIGPRDIAFVVDLSGSMNDDSEPCWTTQAINAEFSGLGDQVVQQIYTDFNFGTFPGTLQHVGQPAGVTQNNSAYQALTANGGPLTPTSIATTYRITSSDSNATRKQKAYRWIIDKQIAVVMPNAKPTPSSTTNYNYWEKYIDYVINASGYTAPPSQNSVRLTSMANPNTAGYTWASSSYVTPFWNKIGYRTYLQFMLDFGRDGKPDGVNHTPLSVRSPLCPRHNESTAGGTFSFPPREQPTHASRRAIIAAMQVIKERNAHIPDPNQRDWVSLITFDAPNDGGPKIVRSLTGDYDLAMASCTDLQAVGDAYQSTNSESGMVLARQHLRPTSEGGAGRGFANKVVVLLTDGAPNLYDSNGTAINNYMSNNSSANFYGGNSHPKNGALMQAHSMQTSKWQVFAVGIGLGTDYEFMDRMGRMGNTADDNGKSPRGSGNPAEYEQRTAEIFENIISSPRRRLVQ